MVRTKVTEMKMIDLKQFVKDLKPDDLFELDQFELQSLKNFIIGTIINDERLNRLEEKKQNEKKLQFVLTRQDEEYLKQNWKQEEQ